MIRIFGLCAAILGLVLGLGGPAHAQSGTLPASAIALTTGDYLTLDGLKITVNAVSCNDGGTGISPIACNNIFLDPVSGPNPEVIIEAANGATPGVSTLQPIFSYSCPATGSCPTGTYDLTVTLNVQSETNQKILDVGQILTGSASAGLPPSDVHLSEVITNSSGQTLCSQSGASALNLSNPTAVCPSFTPVSYLSISKDLGLVQFGVANGSTLSLVSVAQVFTPEPASAALLLSGLAALGFTRRRRRLS